MDGPNFESLFQSMNCLNGEANLKEIVQYLRFSKSEGGYQTFLAHYLPMLPKEEFDEFIVDVTDSAKSEELKKGFEVKEEEETVEKKKPGRPKKEEPISSPASL